MVQFENDHGGLVERPAGILGFKRGRLHRRQSAGFTLVEIMVVLGVIAVLAGLAIHRLGGIGKDAKIMAAEADIKTLSSALRGYELVERRLPTTEQGIDALYRRPTSEPLARRWHRRVDEESRDPWGRQYGYRSPGRYRPDSFDLWSLGPDGVESEDDITNW